MYAELMTLQRVNNRPAHLAVQTARPPMSTEPLPPVVYAQIDHGTKTTRVMGPSSSKRPILPDAVRETTLM